MNYVVCLFVLQRFLALLSQFINSIKIIKGSPECSTALCIVAENSSHLPLSPQDYKLSPKQYMQSFFFCPLQCEMYVAIANLTLTNESASTVHRVSEQLVLSLQQSLVSGARGQLHCLSSQGHCNKSHAHDIEASHQFGTACKVKILLYPLCMVEFWRLVDLTQDVDEMHFGVCECLSTCFDMCRKCNAEL